MLIIKIGLVDLEKMHFPVWHVDQKMTRRVEFKILTSRVIRFQGKSGFSSMRQIYTFKVKAPIFGDPPSVRIEMLLIFRKGIVHILPSKKYWDPL